MEQTPMPRKPLAYKESLTGERFMELYNAEA